MTLKNTVLILVVILTVNCASASIIPVDLNYDGNNLSFSSIQEAINHAQENDSILIHKGTYSETLTIDKPLRISSISTNPKDVTITSDNSSLPIIHVMSDNVEISSLTIIGSNKGEGVSGVFLDNFNNSLIENNIISNAEDGLVLNTSSKNKIYNNTLIANTFHGIYLINSTGNDLRNNLITANRRGLYLDNSDQNTLTSNNASGNEYYGFALRRSNTNNISNNQFFTNRYGLCLVDSHENTVTDNFASGSEQHGFFLWIATSNVLSNNTLIENENSGIYLSGSNNSLDGNTISKNFNGILIGYSGNFITNNTFSSNKEYGISYLFPFDDNVIKNNIFSDNKRIKKEMTVHAKLLYTILIFLALSVIAYHFDISLLKKALKSLAILALISFVLIVAWYFPFESGLPGNNVYIEDVVANISPINETHSQITLSMNLNYLYKDSYSLNSGDMTDNLSVFVHVSSSSPVDGTYADEITTLKSQEMVTLEYLEKKPYMCTFELESGTSYYLLIDVLIKQEFDCPQVQSEETGSVSLGGYLLDIDLK
jgi:parallel beta-helix repeat protein